MPGMSGLEFLAQVKSLCPQTIRVLTTVAFNIASHIDEINRAEVFQFIIKPWDSRILLETVERGLRKYDSATRSESLKESSLVTNQTLATAALDLESDNQSSLQQISALKANWFQTIQINLRAYQTHFPWLATQVQKVRQLCQELAKELDLSEQDAEILDLGAQLYDLGMLSVPSEIATTWRKNPSQLSATDWEIIHQHPLEGAKLTQFQAPYDAVSELIRCHHERPDGKGYPLGLKGDAIPRLARILGAVIRIYEFPGTEHQAIESLAASPESIDPEAFQVIRQVLEKRTLEPA